MEEIEKFCERIRDSEIRAGFRAAVYQNLLPARTDREYAGHFSITSDGRSFGTENTWPGLDSWQMTGAYLALGQTAPALGTFRFVRASQREDGNLPFAVFPAEVCRDPESRRTYLKGMKYPEDIFRFESGEGATREWIGLYRHWVAENPLSALAAVCYVLTASEIFAYTDDSAWLRENLESVRQAGEFLLSLRTENGLYAGCAFYIEMIPRKEFDGTAQCYIYHAFKALSALCAAAGETAEAEKWNREALALRKAFCEFFVRDGRCGEYVHPERGLVDLHGLSDVNFAAIAFGLVEEGLAREIWKNVRAEPDFWWGGMPTQVVTRPYLIREWELGADVGFAPDRGKVYDMAAMGRVFYLEMYAAAQMQDWERLRKGVALVCRRGVSDGGYWRERYGMCMDGRAVGYGPDRYCEYPAVLVRTVLRSPEVFG